MNARMIKISPVTVAIIAFNFGPPGAFIHRVNAGLKNARMPIARTRIPTIRKTVFTIFIISSSTQVLPLFHMLVFLLRLPLLMMS